MIDPGATRLQGGQHGSRVEHIFADRVGPRGDPKQIPYPRVQNRIRQ